MSSCPLGAEVSSTAQTGFYLHWDKPSGNMSGFVYTGTSLLATCQGLFTLGQAFRQYVRVCLHWDKPSGNLSGFIYTGTSLPAICQGLFTLGQAFWQPVRVYLHWDKPSSNMSGFIYTGIGLPALWVQKLPAQRRQAFVAGWLAYRTATPVARVWFLDEAGWRTFCSSTLVQIPQCGSQLHAYCTHKDWGAHQRPRVRPPFRQEKAKQSVVWRQGTGSLIAAE